MGVSARGVGKEETSLGSERHQSFLLCRARLALCVPPQWAQEGASQPTAVNGEGCQCHLLPWGAIERPGPHWDARELGQQLWLLPLWVSVSHERKQWLGALSVFPRQQTLICRKKYILH